MRRPLRFCNNPLDRVTINRKSIGFLLSCMKRKNARWCLSFEGKIVLKKQENSKLALSFFDIEELRKIFCFDSTLNEEAIWLNLLDEERFTVVLLGSLKEEETSVWYLALSSIEKIELSLPHILSNPRSILLDIEKDEHCAIAGQALSLLAFNLKNKFSSIDGSKTTSIEGGYKRSLKMGKVYPRIDPVVISLVVSADLNRCLLGRMKGMPFFSCLSGFIDACESAFECSKREVYEESGVLVSDTECYLYDTQPWPIGRGGGCELMIAVVAKAVDERIEIHDVEVVEEVKWFTREEINDIIEKKTEKISIPGHYAIAHHLIKHFLQGNFLFKETACKL